MTATPLLDELPEVFKRLGVTFPVSITRTPITLNPSIRADLEANWAIGRITLWSSGRCLLEVLDTETEQRRLDEYRSVSSSEELALAVGALVRELDSR